MKPPFCSIGITSNEYGNDIQDIEFKTNTYSYYVNGNVFNKCTLTYFLQKHYPSIKMLDKYKLHLLTSTGILKVVNGEESITLKED